MFVVGVDEKKVEGHWRRPAPASRLDAEAPWGDPTVCATLCTCAGCGACAQRAASVRSPRTPTSTEGVGEGPEGQGVGCPLTTLPGSCERVFEPLCLHLGSRSSR